MGLLSTGALRTWMGIEEGDKNPNAKLDSISSAVEDFVDGFTNRKLLANTYYAQIDYSYMDGNGLPYIYLPIYPISYISGVYVDNDRIFGSGTLISSNDVFLYSSSGKIVSEAGYFTRGRRNIRVDYIGGYAPVVNGTHDGLISTYPVPYDLKQVMIEMCVESFKEGITAVHTVEGGDQGQPKFVQMLTNNSFWRNTLNKYKAFDRALEGREE